MFAQSNRHNSLPHSLRAVSLHHGRHVGHGSLDVEHLDHLQVDSAQLRRVGLQQGADGAHAEWPVEEPAAQQYAAAAEHFLLLEGHLDEAVVLVGLVVIGLRQLLDLLVDAQDLADGPDALQSCLRWDGETADAKKIQQVKIKVRRTARSHLLLGLNRAFWQRLQFGCS